MKRQTVSKKLNAFAATASAKAKTLTKPRSRKASTADWDVIVHEFAHCLWVNAYLQAVDESTGETNGGTPSENVEVELTRAPWGGGAQLEDYAPDMPESVVLGTEKLLEKAFGKDAVLADAAAFMEESGKSDKTYGWYLCMEQLGHGVGLSDYGYDTKLKDYATHVDSNNMGWLYMDDDRIMFGMETMGDGPKGTADVTRDLQDLVVVDEDPYEHDEEPTEASVRTAAGDYTIVVDGDRINPADFQTAAELQTYLEENHDYSAPPYKWVQDKKVKFVGKAPKLWHFSATNGKKGEAYKITIGSPFMFWAFAKIGYPEALLYMDLRYNSYHMSAAEADKVVADAGSGFSLDYSEYAGSAQHFFKYQKDNLGYLLKESNIAEDVESMPAKKVNALLQEHILGDQSYYTDGFSVWGWNG